MTVPTDTPPSPLHLSVVIPVLNEAASIALLLPRLEAALNATRLSWTIVFVDDGSTDATLAALRSHNRRDDRIKAVALSRNFGKETALAAGLRYAPGDAVVLMDADLQHPPELIPSFVDKWREGFDVVFGQRMDRQSEAAWRRAGARIFYKAFHALSGTPLQENSCDFRLLSRRAVDAVNRIGERVRYNNGLFAWIGYPAVGIPFNTAPRASGEGSRWLPFKLLHFAVDGIATFSTVPLRIASIVGVLISMIGFIAMVAVMIKTLVFGDTVRGYPTLMVTVLFFAGIQLIFLGILGSYLGRVYEEVKARPLFLVRDEIGFPMNSLTPSLAQPPFDAMR